MVDPFLCMLIGVKDWTNNPFCDTHNDIINFHFACRLVNFHGPLNNQVSQQKFAPTEIFCYMDTIFKTSI